MLRTFTGFFAGTRGNRLCILVVMLVLCNTGCREKKKPVQGKLIVYYPLKNVYFDQDRKQFYIYDTAKAEWAEKTRLTTEEETTLGRSVRITDPGVPVYKDNDAHKIVYGAALYTDTAAIQRKYREDSVASVPKEIKKEKDSVTATPSKKKRSKFRSWLDKVFGKKKNKE